MKCHYFDTDHCKSCHLLDKSYDDSLLLKEAELKSLFSDHLAQIKNTIAISGGISGSRHKAKFAVFTQNKKISFGFYHSDGTPEELEKCPLHAEGINALLPNIAEILSKYKIIPYDLATKKGELKYLLMTSSGTEYLLRFVLRSREALPRLKKAVPEILALSSSIKVITANIQPIHQAIFEGDEETVLTDQAVIIHQFDEFKLALGARSFFQVTPQIARELYNAVADAISIDAPQSLIDLYCGVGAFSFYASRHCANVTGVEISKEAIDCANYSAELNQSPIHFAAADVESYLQKNDKNFEAVIVNPPRRGLNSSIIKMIKAIEPRFIYYSSCHAKTLARDFQELKDLYEIKSIQMFDMFPYTKHYETLMCLSKIHSN